MNRFNVCFFLLICSFFSCKKNVRSKNIDTIKIEVQKRYNKGVFDDYFESFKLIPLETVKNSIFRKIDRVYFYEENIFILDKRLGTILIFDNNGKFLNKIQNIGKGPGEYNKLLDFTIDENLKQIILLTNGPNKLVTFNFKGQFIREEKLKEFSFNIGYENNKILLLSKNKKSNKLFQELDLLTEEKKGFINMDEKDEKFWALGSFYPNIIKSINNNVSLVYSDKIYEYKKGVVDEKYKIDFGESKVQENFIRNLDKRFRGFSEHIKKNNLGFGIANFRETNNYVIFNFWNNNLSIYSKSTKLIESFSFFITPTIKLPFDNYFAHDGKDNKIISIYDANSFKKEMDAQKKKIGVWEELPEFIKNLDKKVRFSDNPLLLVYSFK